MADFSDLKNIIRKGIVQSVDAAKMKARVKYGDKGGIISGELWILTDNRAINIENAQGHTHTASLPCWVPEIGSMVLCLVIPGGDGEGYILGGIK